MGHQTRPIVLSDRRSFKSLCLEEIDTWVTGSNGNRVSEVTSVMVMVEALTK